MNSENINRAAEVVHRAVQLLTKAAKSWLEQKEDDSHTNQSYFNGVFKSHEFPGGLQLALEVSDLQIQLWKDGEQIWHKNLSGRLHHEVEEDLIGILHQNGLDRSQWVPNLHFDLPYKELENFRYPELEEIPLNAFVRTRDFGVDCLNELSGTLNDDPGFRTWPHHFDHGGLLIVATQGGEMSKTVGIGLAMHDSLVPEHYFYISHWIKDGQADYTNLPELPSGGSWIGSQPMAVLPVCQLKRNGTFDKDEAMAFLKLAMTTSLKLLQ